MLRYEAIGWAICLMVAVILVREPPKQEEEDTIIEKLDLIEGSDDFQSPSKSRDINETISPKGSIMSFPGDLEKKMSKDGLESGRSLRSSKFKQNLTKSEAFEAIVDDCTLTQLLNTPQFKCIYLMNVLTILQATFIVGSGVTWGDKHIVDASYVSFVASVASIFGALRFFWSFLLDKFSFKLIYGIMMCFQILIGFSLPSILEIEDEMVKQVLFMIAVCVSFNLEGAHFVIVPTVYSKLFGPKGGIRVFSVGFSFLAFASILNIFVLTFFLDQSGWMSLGFNGICYIYASLGVIALLVLLVLFKEERPDIIVKAD